MPSQHLIPSQHRIGFIGLGLMGQAMSSRLITAGFNVSVWNRTADKSQPLLALGAKPASSIQQLVQLSDIIMLCVTDTDAVEDIVFSDGGIADHGRSNIILIDFSSIKPDATRQFSKQLQQRCNMHWIDAPVSGGVAGAKAGTLAIMAGGDTTTIDSVRPILAHLSQQVTRMGDVGSGQATKICNQMIVSCNVLVMAEVIALAEKSGVDSTKIPEALKGGFADSIPLQLTGTRMANRDFSEIKWHVKTLLKDLNMSQRLSQEKCSNTPMAALAQSLMQQYADQGLSDKDPCILIDRYTDD